MQNCTTSNTDVGIFCWSHGDRRSGKEHIRSQRHGKSKTQISFFSKVAFTIFDCLTYMALSPNVIVTCQFIKSNIAYHILRDSTISCSQAKSLSLENLVRVSSNLIQMLSWWSLRLELAYRNAFTIFCAVLLNIENGEYFVWFTIDVCWLLYLLQFKINTPFS